MMETFHVPDLLKNSNHKLIQGDETTIVNYHQDEEIEKANVQLSQNLIVFVIRGFKQVLGNQQSIKIEKEQGFFLRKGNYLMSEKFGDGQHYQSLLFFFSDKFAHQFSSKHSQAISGSEAIGNGVSAFATNPPITTFLNSLQTYFNHPELLDQQNDWAELKFKELFLLLLKSSGSNYFLRFLNKLSTKPASQLRDVMNLHYKKPLSLEQYAFLAGYSLSTFKRRFKEEFNTTPGQWIKQQRLQEAKFLLHSTHQNVSEVCFEVGFENLSHFIQSFKEQYGTTPKQFQLDHSAT